MVTWYALGIIKLEIAKRLGKVRDELSSNHLQVVVARRPCVCLLVQYLKLSGGKVPARKNKSTKFVIVQQNAMRHNVLSRPSIAD